MSFASVLSPIAADRSRVRRVTLRTAVALAAFAFLLLGVCIHAEEQETNRAVMLRTSVPEKEADVGLLTRELVRQAFLIAARDEMGLATRDATLREDQRESRAEGGPFEISVTEDGEHDLLVKVFKASKDPTLLKAVRLKIGRDTGLIARLTAQAEALSRKEFVAALTDAKCTPRKLAPASDTKVPRQADEQLSKLSCLSQLSAIRLLHREMKKSGESSALLTALSRAYVQLGSLTQFHWSPAHKVFQARALLYAERLSVKYPGRAALHTRAYVRAFVGLHQGALDDLASEGKLPKEQQEPQQQLIESEIINSFCRGESEKLAQYSETSSQKLLASYLQFLTVEPTGHYELRMKAIETLLQHAPGCLQALDSLVDGAPLGIHNAISVNAPRLFSGSLYQEIAAFEDLPANVRKLASVPSQEYPARLSLMQALWTAGRAGNDAHEPSLTVAGNLIQDVGFIHVWRRLDLERYKYAWNLDETLEASRILVKSHPYAAFIESHHTNQRVLNAAVQNLIKLAEEDPNLELTEQPIYLLISRFEQTKGAALRARMIRRNDSVYQDLVKMAGLEIRDRSQTVNARRLREVSPFLPATIAATILNDWEYGATQVANWEKTYGSETLVQDALSRRYRAMGKLDDAERWMKRRIETLPDQFSYRALADFYKAKGDEDKWAQTLIDSFEIENHGLEEVSNRVELANYFMDKHEVEKAIEHADAAATSEAAWALICAAECHEQTGDMKSAEEFVRRNAQHYTDTAATDWYFWCRRTGFGDVEAAREFTTPYIEEKESSSNADAKAQAAMFYYAEGNNDRAIELLHEAFTLVNNVDYAIQASLIADEAGDEDQRDSLLNDALDSARAVQFPMGNLFHDFRNALLPEDAIPFDTQVNRWRLQLITAQEAAMWNSYIGQFLMLRGKVQEAVPFLQDAATSFASQTNACTYAGIVLERHNIKRDQLRRRNQREPSIRFQEALSIAHLMTRGKNFDGARQQLKVATELEPDSFAVLYVRSALDAATGEREAAIKEITRCIEQLPQGPDMLLERAKWNNLEHDYQAAIHDLEKIIELDPDFGEAYYHLAAILACCEVAELRDGKRALQLAQKSLEADSEVPNGMLKLGLAAACAETGDFAEAIKHVEEVSQGAPPHVQPTINKVLALFREQKPLRRDPK